MIRPLTKRQREVLDYISTTIRDKGYAPSLREIGDTLGMRSLATVSKHADTLREKGYITRQWNHSRSITLVAEHGACPTCGRAMPDGETPPCAPTNISV